MNRLLKKFTEAFRACDRVLLLLCVVASAFGCLIIASATNYMGSLRYILLQVAATLVGVIVYVFLSSVSTDSLSEHRSKLVIFNVVLLLMLIPFGTDNGTGNRSWLDIPILPFYIQPAELCKVPFIVIMASVMASHQNQISHVRSVMHMALHLGILFALNMVLSRDLGVSLIYIFIFAGMAFSGGVSLLWFGGAVGLLVLGFPILWNFLSDFQRNRILVLFDPSLDPNGIDVRYHTERSLRTLTGGGMTGQGLFQGNRTQSGALFAQHTDYIFSAIGEELGFIGCLMTVILLGLIIARCIWVGNRSSDYLRRMVCYGAASVMIFQVISNVGMCIGITPVIGLTLPFISYGASSIGTMYLMMGLVSAVFARPAPVSHERYIRPPGILSRH